MKILILVLAIGTSVTARAAETRSFEGVDEHGDRCALELTATDQGELVALHYQGTFTAHYKIPTPGSGLYGDYRWEGEFTMDRNTDASGLKVRKRLLWGGTEIKAHGKPIFWDVPESDHLFVLKGDLESPESLTYQEKAPFPQSLMVEVKADCQELRPAPLP